MVPCSTMCGSAVRSSPRMAIEKKYSTGTKGRLEKHADQCKELIRQNCPSLSLAREFIASIDPDFEPKTWQAYQEPADVLPELSIWLGGGEETPAPVIVPPAVAPVLRKKEICGHIGLALKKTQAWMAGPAVAAKFSELEKADAIAEALEKMAEILTELETGG